MDLGLYGDVGRIRKRYRPQIAVGAVMLTLTFVTLFVPIVYYITEQNVYERRLLSYFYYFVILYYCFSAVYVTRRYEKEFGVRTFMKEMDDNMYRMKAEHHKHAESSPV